MSVGDSTSTPSLALSNANINRPGLIVADAIVWADEVLYVMTMPPVLVLLLLAAALLLLLLLAAAALLLLMEKCALALLLAAPSASALLKLPSPPLARLVIPCLVIRFETLGGCWACNGFRVETIGLTTCCRSACRSLHTRRFNAGLASMIVTSCMIESFKKFARWSIFVASFIGVAT